METESRQTMPYLIADYLDRHIAMCERMEVAKAEAVAKVKASGGRVVKFSHSYELEDGRFEYVYADYETGDVVVVELMDLYGHLISTAGDKLRGDVLEDSLDDDDLFESLDDPCGIGDWANEQELPALRSLLSVLHSGIG